MSAAQCTTVHDGLLHPHLRHCSSPASAVRTATPAFDVLSSRLFCSRPGGLELVITRLPARSVTFLRQFSPRPENFSFLVLLAYTAHYRLCHYAPYKSTIDMDTDVDINSQVVKRTVHQSPINTAASQRPTGYNVRRQTRATRSIMPITLYTR